ncbi:hypothetical protein FACHB389_35900 [Nostoc calcicola FACHB-389]|nr:hypothetical protein [Nostoc calcicola FACHB-3891]OKH14605.1 hypothetical protein FACHB389_35900 [Nostoc calcicola FACHB-389]
MELLSLTQIFGEGAFQNENILVIQKASLLKLTPKVDNTAESLLAGILITALSNFKGIITDENNQSITDENNQLIAYENSEAFELIKIIGWQPFRFTRNNQRWIKHQIIIEKYSNDSN